MRGLGLLSLDLRCSFIALRPYGAMKTAAVIVVLVLAAEIIPMESAGVAFRSVELRWAAAAVVAAVGLLYRYLKFFRLYSVEVFVRYAELESSNSANSA